jgi:dolichyldiphosphatase
MFRQAWLYVLQNTQFVVTTLTVYFILRIRTAHSLYFGAGTLVAAFSGSSLFLSYFPFAC